MKTQIFSFLSFGLCFAVLGEVTVHKAPLKSLLIDNASVVTDVTGTDAAKRLEAEGGKSWIDGEGVVHRVERKATVFGKSAVLPDDPNPDQVYWIFDAPEFDLLELCFDWPSSWRLECERMEDVEDNGEIRQELVQYWYEGSAPWNASSVTLKRENYNETVTVSLEFVTNSTERLALASEISANLTGGLTTNDVCAIVTNTVEGEFSPWTATVDIPENDWLDKSEKENFRNYTAKWRIDWSPKTPVEDDLDAFWSFYPLGTLEGKGDKWFIPPPDVEGLDENATNILFIIAAESEPPWRNVCARTTRARQKPGNVLGLAMAKDVVSAEAVTNIARDVSNLFWDEKNSVLWRLDFRDGEPMFVPVTNTNAKAGGVM